MCEDCAAQYGSAVSNVQRHLLLLVLGVSLNAGVPSTACKCYSAGKNSCRMPSSKVDRMRMNFLENWAYHNKYRISNLIRTFKMILIKSSTS